MESARFPHQPTPMSTLSRNTSTRSFSSLKVAPLNITPRSFTKTHFTAMTTTIEDEEPISSPLFLNSMATFTSPTSSSLFSSSSPSTTSSTPRSYHPLSLTSETRLEANVRHLCDLVDSVIIDTVEVRPEQRTCHNRPASSLHIQIPSRQQRPQHEEAGDDVVSSLLTMVMSPTTLYQARSDISKVDQTIVSTLNCHTLLSLFPSPPESSKSCNGSISLGGGCRPLSTESFETEASLTSSPILPPSPIHPLGLPLGVETSTVTASTMESVTSESVTMTTEKTLAAKTPTAAPAAIAKAMVTTTQPLMKTSKRPELCTRRNWAIPPGLALLQNHASANSPNNTQEIPSPCSSSRSSSLPDQRLLHIIPSSPSILSIPSSPSPSSSPLASPTSTTKTLAAIETLSQRLWAIETQMRRPSFLVSGRRSSILSTLFTSNVISPLSPLGPNNTCFTPVNTQKLELESLKLTLPMPVLPLGWADNHNYSSPRSSIEHRGNKDEQHSSVPETPTTAVEPSPKEEGDVDWRAWHANWTRRRAPKSSKLQKEHQQFLQSQNISNTTGFSALSPLSPMSPASFSTSATTLCSPTFSQPMSGTSTLCSRVASFEALHTNASRKFWQSAAATAAANANATVSSRYHPSSSSSPLKKFITAPANTGSGISAICDHKERGIRKPATSSIKDANPELWEDDQGQKWKDRFQSLVHNFQTSAGKHSRRLADILPKAKSRWGNKRASSQSPSSSSQSQEHRQQHYQEPVVVHKKQAKPLPRVQAAKIWGHS